MKSELLGETAIALMGGVGLGGAGGTTGSGRIGYLIAVQVGNGANLASLLRHRFNAPASIVLESPGSRVNGAMKFALAASVIPKLITTTEFPPSVLRNTTRLGFSP